MLFINKLYTLWYDLQDNSIKYDWHDNTLEYDGHDNTLQYDWYYSDWQDTTLHCEIITDGICYTMTERARHYDQHCQIYYDLYNILYGAECHTISIKVGKIYYKMLKSK